MHLTCERLSQGLAELTANDPKLNRVVEAYGRPPMWRREPGFATLVLIIMEQQVSLSSAAKAYDRFRADVVPFTPQRLLELDMATLQETGVTRQKLGYCRHLAAAIVDGSLRLDRLDAMGDTAVRHELMAIKGIGRWSADIYLLRALLRADVWPRGDLALAVAMQDLSGLAQRPAAERYVALAERWRPWRAVAARVLWHYYLTTRGRGMP